MLSLSGISPTPGEKLVSLNSPIEFTIVDDGDGIDISTLIVEVKGIRALNGLIFSDNFNGSLSSVTSNDSDFIVVIDPEFQFSLGTVYDVKIQVQTNTGKYFNYTYSFKTIPEEPILVESSPLDGQTLTSSQYIYLEFADVFDGIDLNSITVSINNLEYIKNGVVQANVNGSITNITQESTTAFVRIDPIEPLRNGNYILRYQVSDTLGNKLISDINFSVNLKNFILPSIFPQTGFLGFFQGIKRVSDIGKGDSLLIEWNKPLKRSHQNDVFTLIYQNPLRLNTFDKPKYIATSDILEVEINNLVAGKSLSFGARALEFPTGLFNASGMIEIKPNFYQMPEPTVVSSQMNVNDYILEVEDVNGYPDAGFLFIGNEVIRYTSVDRANNRFLIPVNGRNLINTLSGVYLPGDSVELFTKCTDLNTVIVMGTPTHQDGYGLDRFVIGEGVVVSDFSDNDRLKHPGYDFCGWHSPQPNELLNGINDCGTYLGGEYNGFRGFDLYQRMLDQEEVLLTTTGEPIILLKRIWDGLTCSCMDSRKLHPKVKSCQECFGTGYVGGYNQYYNPRRTDRRLLISVGESPEDLFFGEKEHLQQDHKPTAWTLAIPAIRDRDVIVRFDLTNDITFFYEVLDVSREVIFNRKYGRQSFNLQRMDKTDILNTYPLDLSNIGE